MKLFANIQNTDKKTIFITESQMLDLLIETATIQDIYQKYYAQIPQDIFQKIISYDPTYNPDKPNKMGKFGKWLLSIYQKGNLKIEDLYKAKQFLQTFIKFNSKITPNDITQYKSLADLYNKISPFLDNPQQTASKGDEIRKIKEGAEKVYEDNKWIVIVPHTQEASCYYGKGTQWCTAADYSDNMFKQYNERGNLYINIDKTTNKKYQFHFESDSFMDATDTEIEKPIASTIGLTPQLSQFYYNNYKEEALPLFIDTEYCNIVRGLNSPNMYFVKDFETLIKFNPQTTEQTVLISDYDYNIFDTAKLNRFIPLQNISVVGTLSSNITNLYDVQNEKLVFDKNVTEVMLMSTAECCITIFKNGTQGIYSLVENKFVTQNIPNEVVFTLVNQLSPYFYYPKDLAIANYTEKNAIQLFSLSSGKPISNKLYDDWHKIFPHYNAEEDAFPYALLILTTDDGATNDAVLFDETIIPLYQLQQNPNILKKHFGDELY